MAIRRVKTQRNSLHVLDLSEYEFSPGIPGVAQRVYIAFKHALLRLYNFGRFFSTSFLGLHYVYIIAWSLVLSWILYPQRNISYTDALFQAVSAVSLTGLNTVNVNELKLYQQIFLFIVPLFSHPLTVSTFMVYYRLYMYRKKFRDIEMTSKSESKLRRATTLRQFESQPPATRTDTNPRRFRFHQRHSTPTLTAPDRFPRAATQPASNSPKRSSMHSLNRSSPTSTQNDLTVDDEKSSMSSSSGSPAMDNDVSIKFGDLPRPPTTPRSPVSPSAGPPLVIKSPQDVEADEKRGIHSAIASNPTNDEEPSKIRFGNLPRPQERKDSKHQDLYRSLNLMRSQVANADEDDGPALVIKSPRDIEADERRGIHSAVASPGASGEAENDTAVSPQTHRFSSSSELGPRLQRRPTRADSLVSHASSRLPQEMRANYLSYMPTIGRNSAFIGLTDDQKAELGGVEYRALKALRWVTLAYFVVVLCVGWVFLVPWVYARRSYAEMIRSFGVSPVNFAMTTVLSAFNNNGFCVLPTSLAGFWQTAYVPVVVTFVIFAGNVGTPILLRYGVWTVFKLSPRFGQTRETLGFLLDHPRRCFMLLFPAVTTIWLIMTLLVMVVIEVSLFMILNSGEHSPQPNMGAGLRLLTAYFQSIVVRTVGLNMINIANQHPGMLVLNIVMMYIAIYPVAMSIRKTNVYEEQSIGRYYRDPGSAKDASSIRSSVSSNAIDFDDNHSSHQNAPNDFEDSAEGATQMREDRNYGQNLRRRFSSFGQRLKRNIEGKQFADDNAAGNHDALRREEDQEYDDEDDDSSSTLVDHMRRQLSMDIWSLVLGLLLVAITEGGPISRNEFSLFAVVYEVVSAHGTIGLTMGYQTSTLALSGGFTNLGKLIMMAIMIRGRHRAMPYSVDRAIILQSRDIKRRDEEQENRVRSAKTYVHREPGQDNGTWLPRVGTAASRLTSFGTLRRRPSTLRNSGYPPAAEEA